MSVPVYQDESIKDKTPGQKVRLVPVLSSEALKQGQEKSLATWLCLRSLVPWGSGIIDKSEAINGLMSAFGYSRRAAYYALAAGEGAYWTATDSGGRVRLALHSLLRVAQYLHAAAHLDGHFREVPGSEFNTPAKRTAQLYASLFAPRGVRTHPVSRETIKDWTGLGHRQQRRLERTVHVRRVPHYAVKFRYYMMTVNDKHERVERPVENWESIPKDGSAVLEGRTWLYGKKVEPVKLEVTGKSRTYRLNKRLPNAYRTRQEASVRGMLKKALRVVRRSLVAGEACQPTRLYFSGFRKANAALARRYPGDVAYAKVTPTRRTINGRQEYALCQA